MDLIKRADSFAAKAHATQVRKYTNAPYHTHVARVAGLLAQHGLPEPVVAAGFLHDTVEDCGITFEQLRDEFGEEVARLVLEVTDVSRPQDGNRAARKAIDRQHLAKASAHGQSIKLSDITDNISNIVSYDPKWAPKYVQEKVGDLEVLVHGHPELFSIARRTIDDATAQLAALGR